MMGRQSAQINIFEGSALFKHKIEPGSIYHLLHHLGDECLSDDDFAQLYDHSTGRPSIPPSLLAKVLLLQRHDNVSDREAARRVQFDLRWLYALRLPLGYEGFAHANLCHFRSRLIVHNLERVPFDRFNELAIELGVLAPAAEQAIDSSHIFGAAAVQDTYRLLRSGLRKLLLTLLDKAPARLQPVIAELGLEGYESREKPALDWDDAEARAAWLKQIVTDSRRLLEYLDGSELVDAEVRKAAELLSQLLNQDIAEPADDSGPTLKQGVAKDRIISTEDPEMRHGRKSQSKRFDGYKVHLSEDLQSELITNVEVTPGNVHDSEPAPGMIKEQQERLGATPTTLYGDSHYGTADNRAALAALGVEMVAKLPPNPQARSGRFTKADFTLDLPAGLATCPAGHTTHAVQVRDRQGRAVKRFQFPAEHCHSCSLRERCTTAKKGRSITLHYHEELLAAARAYNATAEFQHRYRKRSVVERKLAELLWRHGLRYGRYIGTQKIKLQALWTAAVVNLKRLGKLVPEYFQRPPEQVLAAA